MEAQAAFSAELCVPIMLFVHENASFVSSSPPGAYFFKWKDGEIMCAFDSACRAVLNNAALLSKYKASARLYQRRSDFLSAGLRFEASIIPSSTPSPGISPTADHAHQEQGPSLWAQVRQMLPRPARTAQSNDIATPPAPAPVTSPSPFPIVVPEMRNILECGKDQIGTEAGGSSNKRLAATPLEVPLQEELAARDPRADTCAAEEVTIDLKPKEIKKRKLKELDEVALQGWQAFGGTGRHKCVLPHTDCDILRGGGRHPDSELAINATDLFSSQMACLSPHQAARFGLHMPQVAGTAAAAGPHTGVAEMKAWLQNLENEVKELKLKIGAREVHQPAEERMAAERIEELERALIETIKKMEKMASSMDDMKMQIEGIISSASDAEVPDRAEGNGELRADENLKLPAGAMHVLNALSQLTPEQIQALVEMVKEKANPSSADIPRVESGLESDPDPDAGFDAAQYVQIPLEDYVLLRTTLKMLLKMGLNSERTIKAWSPAMQLLMQDLRARHASGGNHQMPILNSSPPQQQPSSGEHGPQLSRPQNGAFEKGMVVLGEPPRGNNHIENGPHHDVHEVNGVAIAKESPQIDADPEPTLGSTVPLPQGEEQDDDDQGYFELLKLFVESRSTDESQPPPDVWGGGTGAV